VHKIKEHPELFNTGHVWNKGKTKETDARIAKSVEHYKQHIQDGTI